MTTDPPPHATQAALSASWVSRVDPAATIWPPELRACYRQAMLGAQLPLLTGVGIFLLWLPLRGLSESIKDSLEHAGLLVLSFSWIPLLWGLTWLVIFTVRARRQFAWP